VYQTLQAAYQRNCTWLSVEAVVSAGGVDGSGQCVWSVSVVSLCGQWSVLVVLTVVVSQWSV